MSYNGNGATGLLSGPAVKQTPATSDYVLPPGKPLPVVDLRAQYSTLRDEVAEALQEVADSMFYVLGPKVDEFEEKFTAYCGSKHAVGLNSGTSALHLALICAGVGHGDE